jgi:hypothetical protein
MVWVRERTIPTERPPLVGEMIANFCGYRVPRGQCDGSLRPYFRFSRQATTFLFIYLFYLSTIYAALKCLSGFGSVPLVYIFLGHERLVLFFSVVFIPNWFCYFKYLAYTGRTSYNSSSACYSCRTWINILIFAEMLLKLSDITFHGNPFVGPPVVVYLQMY